MANVEKLIVKYFDVKLTNEIDGGRNQTIKIIFDLIKLMGIQPSHQSSDRVTSIFTVFSIIIPKISENFKISFSRKINIFL